MVQKLNQILTFSTLSFWTYTTLTLLELTELSVIDFSANLNQIFCLACFVPQKFVPYRMFILSLSDSRQLRIYYIPWPAKKIAAQNSYTNLSAINSQKLCSLHSQLAKAAKKRTSNEHVVPLYTTVLSHFC